MILTGATTRFDFEQYRDVLNPEFADYLAYEPDASRVWHYSPSVVSAWLQTDQYTIALNLGTSEPGTTDETHTRRLEVRRARRRLLNTAEQVHIVMSETVFWRRVAPGHPSDEIMRAQLDRIRQANSAPNVTVQVLPVDRSLLRGAFTQFTVLTHPDGGLVYREGTGKEALCLDPARVVTYEEHFQELTAASVDLATAADRRPPAWLTADGSP